MNQFSYDEDLSENSFFQELRDKHKYLIERATTEGWIICIPKSGTTDNNLTEEDFLYHILISDKKLGESNYRTLNGKEVKVLNKVIIIKNDSLVPSLSTSILFEETFYTENLDSYKVWCIECLINQNYIKCKFNNSSVFTLRDCIDFLWRESLGKEILEQLDGVITDFSIKYENIHEFSLSVQRDFVNTLYTQCLKIALCDVKLSESISKNKYNINNINISVEAYMQHSLYKSLFNSISVHTACEDSHFNKIVRNLSDIQLRDLDIIPEIYDIIPCAKHQLAKINGFSTILGKISCLRNTISEISLSKTKTKLSADELLPALVFLILKSCVPNWIANLYFLKEYQFSCLSSGDETNFLITSLEAAIEYTKSGVLSSDDKITYIKNGQNGHKNDIDYFFYQIQLGNHEEIKVILEKNNTSNFEFEVKSKELCHPLCSCDKCERILTQITLDSVPNVHSSNDRGRTALHIACMYGKPKIVELLLEYNSNLKRCDFSGATPLHYAAMKGHQNALLLLLHSGADINALDNEKNTPLHFSSNNGHVACVKAILYFAEHRTNLLNINCTNVSGDTPLHHASRWGYKSIVHILLEHGADPNIENKLKKTTYDYAHNLKIYDIIMQAKTTYKIPEKKIEELSLDYDFVDDSITEEKPRKPCSPREMKKAELLLRAVAYDDLPMICYYLGLPLPPNHFKTDNLTLCHPLCNCEKCEMSQNNITVNFKDKQDINVCNSEGYTALHVASLHGQIDIVKLLISNGALANVPTNKGLTALHLACQTERLEIVQLLLDCDGCKINLQDYKGNTALHLACHSRDLEIIKILLKRGADLNIRNENGKTALDEADGKIVSFINDFENS